MGEFVLQGSFGVRRPGVSSQPRQSPPPWADCLIARGLSFLIHKKELLIPTAELSKIMTTRPLAQCCH